MELFEQIRREYEFGVGTIAGVAKKLGVHRRMVREAVGSALPKPRKKTERPRWKLKAGGRLHRCGSRSRPEGNANKAGSGTVDLLREDSVDALPCLRCLRSGGSMPIHSSGFSTGVDSTQMSHLCSVHGRKAAELHRSRRSFPAANFSEVTAGC